MALTRRKLAYELADLVNVPLFTHRGGGKALKVLNAVIKAMTQALQAGQTINVAGFGIFSIEEPKPRMVTQMHGKSRWTKGDNREPYLTSPKVIFEPALDLLRYINK